MARWVTGESHPNSIKSGKAGQPLAPGMVRNGRGDFPIKPDRYNYYRRHADDPRHALRIALLTPDSTLGTRITNALIRSGLKSINSVARMEDDDLMMIREIGVTAVMFIRSRIPHQDDEANYLEVN